MGFLELTGVDKSFGSFCALRGINLSIDRGELVAILGFSGSGKTTLINLIAGLLRPDAGILLLNDLEINGAGLDRGVVFQNYSLLPWLTVFANILLAVDQANPNWSPSKKRGHVDKFIGLVNLEPARDKYPAQLSGGMRQRVSVARALAIEPQILLLDEPLSALDALTRATLQDEISRIHQQTRSTIVLITNDPDEGLYLADRIIPLTAGPGSTLGPSFRVESPRPRNRKALNHDPQLKKIRRELIEFMLQSKEGRPTASGRKLVLPDIEPADLSRGRPRSRLRAGTRGGAEIKKEIIQAE
jgi:nitrate/nitrite transport system ATP-binding protein